MNSTELRIGVAGAGAIGGWIAATLALGGSPVGVLARGETLVALRGGGLRLNQAGQSAVTEVTASDDPAELGQQDLLIIAVKAPALADIADAVRPMIGTRTRIIPMLNGVPWWFTRNPLRAVDPERRIAAALPFEQVIGCVVHAACSRPAPGEVVVQHADRLILGEPNGAPSERVEHLAELFEEAGISVEKSENVRRSIWYKLWGNATINPLSALTRSTADQLLADPAVRGWMLEAMAELATVGAAIGCPDQRKRRTANGGHREARRVQDLYAAGRRSRPRH